MLQLVAQNLQGSTFLPSIRRKRSSLPYEAVGGSAEGSAHELQVRKKEQLVWHGRRWKLGSSATLGTAIRQTPGRQYTKQKRT